MPEALLDALRYRRIRARLAADSSYTPRAAAGGDLRGALGKALAGTPTFERLFQPPLPEGRELPRDLRGGQGAPPPLVVESPQPRRLPSGGGALSVELLSFLDGEDVAAAWVSALATAAAAGFGRDGTRFALTETSVGAAESVGDYARSRWDQLTAGAATARLRVNLRTPARLLTRGSPDPVTPGSICRSAVRRVRALAALYGTGAPDGDLRPLVESAEALAGQFGYLDGATWRKASRWSGRQGKRVPLDGWTGFVESWIPNDIGLVLLGAEVLHIGKGTVHGLGAVRVTAPVMGGGTSRREPAGA